MPGQEESKPAISRPASPAVSAPAPSPSAISPVQRKDNLIAALAYVTFIPAIVFVLTDAFKRNRFIRFHSYQSIFLAVATVIAAIAMRILYSLLALIPALGYLLAWLATAVTLLGWIVLWLVLVVKALQGDTLRLPWIGSLAEKA